MAGAPEAAQRFSNCATHSYPFRRCHQYVAGADTLSLECHTAGACRQPHAPCSPVAAQTTGAGLPDPRTRCRCSHYPRASDGVPSSLCLLRPPHRTPRSAGAALQPGRVKFMGTPSEEYQGWHCHTGTFSAFCLKRLLSRSESCSIIKIIGMF